MPEGSMPEGTGSGICWLASYPKSGNTWLRTLISNYVRNENRPLDINTLESPLASSRIVFDEWTGIEASALDPDTIDCLRPEVFRRAAREEPGPVFFKVHDAFRLNSRGEPLFPPDASRGAVYIVRHAMDVALSLARHAGITAEAAVDAMCEPGHTAARSDGRLDDQLHQVLGTWSAHVRSWVDQTAIAVHCIRYEDLLRDTAGVFAGVARFCGLPVDEARIGRAVAFSDFGELQRQERANGFRERPEFSAAPFFRQGRAGGWQEELPADLARRLVDAHGETLRRFGYDRAVSPKD